VFVIRFVVAAQHSVGLCIVSRSSAYYHIYIYRTGRFQKDVSGRTDTEVA